MTAGSHGNAGRATQSSAIHRHVSLSHTERLAIGCTEGVDHSRGGWPKFPLRRCFYANPSPACQSDRLANDIALAGHCQRSLNELRPITRKNQSRGRSREYRPNNIECVLESDRGINRNTDLRDRFYSSVPVADPSIRTTRDCDPSLKSQRQEPVVRADLRPTLTRILLPSPSHVETQHVRPAK